MKILVSYDPSNDEYWRIRFSDLFGQEHDVFSFKELSPDASEARAYAQTLSDKKIFDLKTVMVLLIGGKSYARARVDWELSAALTPKPSRPTPIIALRLPTHPDHGRSAYNPSRIPSRLVDNLKAEYIRMNDWTESSQELNRLISMAIRATRDKADEADNSRKLMGKDMIA